jgi:hypothetical protein
MNDTDDTQDCAPEGFPTLFVALMLADLDLPFPDSDAE